MIELTGYPSHEEKREILEKIQQYIQQTRMESAIKKYNMKSSELISLYAVENTGMALVLAFDYGCAKGYRAAKAESKKKATKGGTNLGNYIPHPQRNHLPLV